MIRFGIEQSNQQQPWSININKNDNTTWQQHNNKYKQSTADDKFCSWNQREYMITMRVGHVIVIFRPNHQAYVNTKRLSLTEINTLMPNVFDSAAKATAPWLMGVVGVVEGKLLPRCHWVRGVFIHNGMILRSRQNSHHNSGPTAPRTSWSFLCRPQETQKDQTQWWPSLPGLDHFTSSQNLGFLPP